MGFVPSNVDDRIHRKTTVRHASTELPFGHLAADLLEAVLGTPDPDNKAKEIDIKVSRQLRKHLHDPRFKALAERLEELRQRREQGLLISVEFLKELLDLAKDVVATEQASPPIEQEERGKAALTELQRSRSPMRDASQKLSHRRDVHRLLRRDRPHRWRGELHSIGRKDQSTAKEAASSRSSYGVSGFLFATRQRTS